MTVVIARGEKFPRPLRLDGCVTTPRSVEMPRPDQLLIAIIRTPRAVCRAVLASAMATAKRLVDQFSLRVAVGEAFALRPDTRVNNTDDDIFSGSVMRSRASRTAQLLPQAARIRKPEEARRRRRLDFLKLVWCDC